MLKKNLKSRTGKLCLKKIFYHFVNICLIVAALASAIQGDFILSIIFSMALGFILLGSRGITTTEELKKTRSIFNGRYSLRRNP